MISRLIVVMLSMVCVTFTRIMAYDVQSEYIERFEGRNLTPIEGLWLWNSGALVAIESNPRGTVKLTLVDSPDPLIDTPMDIGHGSFGGRENTYNIELKSNIELKKPGRTVKMIATLTDADHLALKPYKTGVRINFRRLLPYLFRISLENKTAPDIVNGAIKVWPSTGTPEFPIVL